MKKLLFLLLFNPTITHPCAIGEPTERLFVYCNLERSINKIATEDQVASISSQLYRVGQDPLKNYKFNKHQIYPFLLPTLSFSENINGGNPNKPLILGNFVFHTSDKLHQKPGVLLGVITGINARYLYGKRKYLKYGINGAVSRNSQHNLNISKKSADICSINIIQKWWYVDLCINTLSIHKKLSNDVETNLRLVSTHLFSGNNKDYNQVNYGINRYIGKNYKQNQLVLSLDTTYANETFTSFGFMFGDKVENQLTNRMNFSALYGIYFLTKPLKINASFSILNGGSLLGIERRETTRFISISYPLSNVMAAKIGYKNINSSINFFDINSPVFSLNFTSLRLN